MAVSPDFGMRVLRAMREGGSATATEALVTWTLEDGTTAVNQPTTYWTTVVIANLDSTNDLLIKTRNSATVAATITITPTDFEFIVPAGEYREFQVGNSQYIYVASAGTVAYNAYAYGA